MIRLTAERVRSIVAHAETEKQLVSLLRHHKVPFSPDPGGYLIPTRKGMLSARKNRSRFEIHNVSPVPFRP